LLGGYPGLNVTQSGFVPPDTQGAAGPNKYVETTNQTIAMFSPKSTGTNATTDSLNDFWYTQGKLAQTDSGSFLSDPVVVWDEQIQRFIIGDQDVDPNTLVSTFDIAVSKSASPASLTSADWNFFQVKTTEAGYDADYPGNLGWNHDALVFTLNMFPASGSNYHVEVNSISINALANGTALTEGTNAFQKDFSGFSLRPTVMHDSRAGDPMWFVEEGGNGASLNVVKMTNVLSSSASFTTTNLAVNPYYQAVPELQPNGTAITTNTDSRIMKAAMQNGMIVAAHQVSDAAGNLDEIQWYVINTRSGTPTLQQQGDVSGGPGTYYAYPGIDINSQGDIGMSYIASGTGTGQYLSVYVTGRNPTDPAGTMESSILVHAGQANDIYDGREGDLSGISVDSNGSFWISNEYAAANGSWGTAIANFTVVPPTPTGLKATAVSSSQINLSWNSAPGALSYTLWRSPDGTSWYKLATTSGTTYADTGLPSDTIYYYRIQANGTSDGLGSSAYSAPVSAVSAPRQTIGVFDPNTATWALRNENSAGYPDAGQFQYGYAGLIPVVGDWNGSGHTGIGLYNPQTATWILREEDSAGNPDVGVFQFGYAGLIPVVGDWNGSGHTGIGLYNPQTATWILRNEVGPGSPDAGVFQYGYAGLIPVVGDWNGSGHTGIGLFDPKTATWILRNEVGPGSPDAGVFQYGYAGVFPVVGHWNGSASMSVSPATIGSGTVQTATPSSAASVQPAVQLATPQVASVPTQPIDAVFANALSTPRAVTGTGWETLPALSSTDHSAPSVSPFSPLVLGPFGDKASWLEHILPSADHVSESIESLDGLFTTGALAG
jgi:hypothetical protein